MRSNRFLPFTVLFFATAAQAAPSDETKVYGENVSRVVAAYPTLPDSRLPEHGGNAEWGNRAGTMQNPNGDARYGTGYETRHGLGARGVRGRGR